MKQRLIDVNQVISDIKSHNNIAENNSTWRTKDVVTLLENAPEPPNDPLTLNELREMDGEPVYGADGECYIVNVQNEYAADKYRGFRMLWEEGFFYRCKPEEGTDGT